MKRFSRMLAVGALVCSSGHAAMAQEVCGPGDREMIVMLSQSVLDGRLELTGFAPPRYGATSAYFLYHYGGMTDAAALGLFTGLSVGGRREAVQLADDMAAALSVHMFGVERGLSVLDPDLPRALHAAFSYTQRSVLRADAGASYFALVDVVRNDPEYEQIAPDMGVKVLSVSALLRDLPEAERREIASTAEAYGEFVVAGQILATMDDGFAGYQDLLTRLPDDNVRDFVTSMTWSTTVGEPSGGRHIFELDTGPSAETVEFQMNLALTMMANNRSGTFGWLSIFLNQSGQDAASARAAQTYLAGLEAGEIEPWNDMEGAWLVMYRGLRAEAEPGSAALTLNSFDVPKAATRHFAGRAFETIERMMVLEALEGRATPDPEIANHPLMARFAPLVSELVGDPATFVPQDVLEAQIAVELLWRDGQRDVALAQAQSWLEPKERLNFYRDVAARLDMQCDGILAYPGRALYLGGQPLFSFPPVLRSEWDN